MAQQAHMSFSRGDRVVHLVTGEYGTVLKDWRPPVFVHVQFDDDIDEDGRWWPWRTEPEKLALLTNSHVLPL